MGEETKVEETKVGDMIPVVVDGAVEYLPPDTMVKWPKRPSLSQGDHALGSFGRVVETGKDQKSAFVLPDGREGQIEGWKEEALRLRAQAMGQSAPPVTRPVVCPSCGGTRWGESFPETCLGCGAQKPEGT